MSKNMFSVFASDSEDEGKAKEETKKVAPKTTKPTNQKEKPQQPRRKEGESKASGDAEQNPTRGRGARGARGTRGERGTRGRGRGGNTTLNHNHFVVFYKI